MKKADLHIHSVYSDGSDDLQTLVKKVQKKGLKCFALTDHDGIDGIDEIKRYVPKDLTFISGIEFTCVNELGDCHILGYGFDSKNADFLNAIKTGKILRRNKLDFRLDYLERVYHIKIKEEDRNYLYSLNTACKPHVANILVKYGICKSVFEAIDTYLKNIPVKNDKLDYKVAIEGILSAGGIPIWAHPLGGEHEKHISRELFLKKLDLLVANGIKGVECYYSRYNKREVEFLKEETEKRGLLISGGSDYHGKNKTVELGRLNTFKQDVDLSELTVIERLFDRR